MTRDEMAALLNGREYTEEMDRDECAIAKGSGLLVVFGASDDLTEFAGVLDDEACAYDGATHVIGTNMRLMERHEEHDELVLAGWTPPKELLTINAEWCPEGFEGSWRIGFDGAHSKFHIMEDGELYCEGIVIDVKEVSHRAPSEIATGEIG